MQSGCHTAALRATTTVPTTSSNRVWFVRAGRLTGFPAFQTSYSTCSKHHHNNNIMYILGERDVKQALDPQGCLHVTKQALISLTEQTSVVPSRLALPYPHNPNLETTTPSSVAQDWTLIKPAAYYATTKEETKSVVTSERAYNEKNNDVVMGLKVVSVRSQNPTQGLPLVPATILLLDAASGVVQAVLAGTYITAMRTSAGPALAVQAFQPNAQHIAVFGAGTQAQCHIQLIQVALKRNIPRITIINRTLERANDLRMKLFDERKKNEEHPGIIDTVALQDRVAMANALSTADVVATTTNTTTPLWDEGDNVTLQKGCLLTGIGSYTPEMKELPASVVDRCAIVIDTPEAMQVGDLKHLGTDLKESFRNHPVTLAGTAWQDPQVVFRQRDLYQKDYIFYKAVGTAIQDVLQAKAVLVAAKQLQLGQEVDMS